MKVSLKTITPEAEVNIVEIARVSSNRIDKSEAPEGLINYLIRNKHWSPFQHSYMTIEVDTSKAIGIQMLRHLSFTFQEFSQRYAKVESIEDIEFRFQAEKNRQSSTDTAGTVLFADGEFIVKMEPDLINDDIHDYLMRVANNMRTTQALYNEGIERFGLAKECVRFILPLATSTKLYMTGSVRSWIHFLEIRDDGHAQKEIQLLAKDIKRVFMENLPIISKARGFSL